MEIHQSSPQSFASNLLVYGGEGGGGLNQCLVYYLALMASDQNNSVQFKIDQCHTSTYIFTPCRSPSVYFLVNCVFKNRENDKVSHIESPKLKCLYFGLYATKFCLTFEIALQRSLIKMTM